MSCEGARHTITRQFRHIKSELKPFLARKILLLIVFTHITLLFNYSINCPSYHSPAPHTHAWAQTNITVPTKHGLTSLGFNAHQYSVFLVLNQRYTAPLLLPLCAVNIMYEWRFIGHYFRRLGERDTIKVITATWTLNASNITEPSSTYSRLFSPSLMPLMSVPIVWHWHTSVVANAIPFHTSDIQSNFQFCEKKLVIEKLNEFVENEKWCEIWYSTA